MISIIIPTLNEGIYLPRLLECIKNQTYKDYEIIVADNSSKDNTVKIAERYGCKIIKGGLTARGRNNGAKAAKGDILLFLDSDVAFGKDFLRNALLEFERGRLDVAGCYLYPSKNYLAYNLFFGVYNIWVSTTQYFYPNAFGGAILCRRWLHEKVGGFDETIKLSEDMDYVKRCGRIGKFRTIKGSSVIFSVRRFEVEGRWRLALKLFLSSMYRIVFGEIRSDIFNYRMDKEEYKKMLY